METRQPEPPEPNEQLLALPDADANRKPAGYVMVTRGQFAIRHAGRGQAGDVNRLSPLEWKVMAALSNDMWRFNGRSRMTNLEIGLFIGMDGDEAKIARRIMRVLIGRDSHGKQTPGLEGKGFILITRITNPRLPFQREIEYTKKWLEANGLKLAETEPHEAAPAPASAGTAAVTVSTLAMQAELPTLEQREKVFGKLTRAYTRHELAERLIKRLRDRLMGLDLVDGVIKPRRLNAAAEPLSEEEAACIKWLREEVIAELRPKAAPETAAATTPKTAPRVANQAEIRALIGRLPLAPPGDETDCEALADSLVAQFKDEKPDLSRQTYLGIARTAARGELPLNIVLEAFEEACKSRKKNRGAAFIAELKRLKAHHAKMSEGK